VQVLISVFSIMHADLYQHSFICMNRRGANAHPRGQEVKARSISLPCLLPVLIDTWGVQVITPFHTDWIQLEQSHSPRQLRNRRHLQLTIEKKGNMRKGNRRPCFCLLMARVSKQFRRLTLPKNEASPSIEPQAHSTR
jgi:hypothetical protein